MKDAATVADDAPCSAAELLMRSPRTHSSVPLLFRLVPRPPAHLRGEQKTWKMVTCPIFGVLGGPGESPDSVGSGGGGGGGSSLWRSVTLTDAACYFHLEIWTALTLKLL